MKLVIAIFELHLWSLNRDSVVIFKNLIDSKHLDVSRLIDVLKIEIEFLYTQEENEHVKKNYWNFISMVINTN